MSLAAGIPYALGVDIRAAVDIVEAFFIWKIILLCAAVVVRTVRTIDATSIPELAVPVSVTSLGAPSAVPTPVKKDGLAIARCQYPRGAFRVTGAVLAADDDLAFVVQALDEIIAVAASIGVAPGVSRPRTRIRTARSIGCTADTSVGPSIVVVHTGAVATIRRKRGIATLAC